MVGGDVAGDVVGGDVVGDVVGGDVVGDVVGEEVSSPQQHLNPRTPNKDCRCDTSSLALPTYESFCRKY